ncbi:MAG: MFS transporter [Bacteroidales bacterium]|nr:MFS transporter [Bacteroidales bacterium]
MEERLETSKHRIYITGKSGYESLNPVLVFILAVACGATVANLYWAQPLLDTIANAFHSSTTAAGMIVTFTQLGYAVGLLFLVPLGDLFERKRLIISILLLTALSLIVASFSTTLHLFIIASLIIGVTSVVAQILVPFAATLAKDHERGKVVGQVMSGLLIGILLARTLAGFISEFAGWRAVFGFAALLIVIQVIVLAKYLPRYKMELKLNYPGLLLSVWELVKTERVLRVRSVYGALVFANFSVLWTSLTFLLAGPSYKFSDALIGLFGLVGAAGAFSANMAGRWADKGLSNKSTIAFLSINLVAFLLMILGTKELIPLVIGIVVLDAGVQGTHITNQSEIYKVRPDARSRITTAYMTTYFIGGAIGSATSATTYEAFGWVGVCFLGTGFALMAILFWFFEQFVLNRK